MLVEQMNENSPSKNLARGGPSESCLWDTYCTISFKRVAHGRSWCLVNPVSLPFGLLESECIPVILTPVGL